MVLRLLLSAEEFFFPLHIVAISVLFHSLLVTLNENMQNSFYILRFKSPRSILAHLLHRGKQFLCQVSWQYISFSDKICISDMVR